MRFALSFGASTRVERRLESVSSERPMPYLIRLLNRVCDWLAWRVPRPAMTVDEFVTLVEFEGRTRTGDRTHAGMRVYSLCGCCGTPLGTSATLCDGCANRRSPSAPRA